MFEKIMESIAEINRLDGINEYLITKQNNDYILCKMDMKGCVCDIGFADDISNFRKLVQQTYCDIYYTDH